MRYSNHNVLVKNPHLQSCAALVMLTRKLAPKPMGYRVWLKYRSWYLNEHYKKHKGYYCQYCGKGPLKKHSDVSDDVATLDHVVPTSKGGPKFLSCNIVVACYRCNNKKTDRPKDEFLASLK